MMEIELLSEQLTLLRENRRLRRMCAGLIGIGLFLEINALFYIVVGQGMYSLPFFGGYFHLEQWTFDVFTSAVLLQTFGLARLVVKNLFPDASKDDREKPRQR